MKSTKKLLAILLALVLVLAACSPANKETGKETGAETGTETNAETSAENNETDGKTYKLGVLLYNGSDNYIGTVRQALEALDAADDSIELDIQDGQNNQATQLEQIDAMIAKQVDGLLINIVDFGSGKSVKEKVAGTNIPTVFWNRDISADLTADDLAKFIFYGTVAPQAGVMQGEMAYENWTANKALDRNGDGKLQYVMLHGGLDNAEAKARTEESIKYFKDKGVEVEEIGMQVAEWDADKAKQAVDAWMAKDGDKIEMIFSNNDGMAFGAITALQEAGYNKGDASKHIPVYGVDALADAIKKIEEGTMDGTVRQNNETMAQGMITLIKNKLTKDDWTEGTDLEIYEDGVSVRMDYEKVTKQ
ncbi:galactose ABC transporter substrate-binding protein [Helcococcus sueciensis]|uniref:galactose ABC transporter substrate-binding protein n=1 Tax=Helcococcus sueciensis TaxID=241555 RepID=UPI000424A1ED|nr:galactose ABC transporter substrate-binding protein [Helcococcus sueciensis]